MSRSPCVLTGLVSYTELGVPDPIAKAVDVIGLTWFSVLIKIGALSGLTTVILVLLYGQSRIFFQIAKDGLLPKMFSDVHPSLGTPHKSQLLIGIIVAVVAALTPIDILGEMVSIGTLFAFVLVCGAVVYLRKSDAAVARPFRTPGVPFVTDPRHRLLAPADGVPALADLAAPHRMAGDRPRLLLRLWPQPLGPAQRCGGSLVPSSQWF